MPEVPVDMSLVRFVISVFQLPQGYLAAAYLTLIEWNWVLLQYLDAIPPVSPMKVFLNPDSGVGRPGAPWKGLLIFSNVPWLI